MSSAENNSNTERLSQRDKARILTNDERLSDLYCVINGKKFPIVHLSIANLETFRALTTTLEELFVDVKNYDDFFDFVQTRGADLYKYLVTDVIFAASLVLRINEKKVRRLAKPLGLLNAIILQWIYNLEIEKIQTLYPLPEPDKDDDIDLGEFKDNPLSGVNNLCEKFHWSLKEARYDITYPQMYLMIYEGAWSNEKFKIQSDPEKKSKSSSRKRFTPKTPDGKLFRDSFNSPQEYREYLAQKMGGKAPIIENRKPDGD